LAAAEARNISKAFLKYLAARPSFRSAPFDYPWFLKLHREMFGDVWTWAGGVRTHDLNIGVPHFQVLEQLAALVGDLHSWSGFGHALEIQAVWLHHWAVRIHPFENGNGRWARLLSNIWLKTHGEPIVAWPDRLLGVASEVRDEYLDAIRAADGGNHDLLAGLHRRFTEREG
jgi:fido (protein-threonine AMPylation protein)